MAETTRNGAEWTIRDGALRVDFDARSLSWSMALGDGKPWRMAADKGADLTLQSGSATKTVSLASAAVKDTTEYHSGELFGVRTVLRGFGNVDVSLAVIVAVDVVSHEVVARLVPVSDPGRALGQMLFPRAFELEATGPGAWHVFPSMQGMLLPPDWPERIDWATKGQMWTRAMYMPWWGAIRPGQAYMGIIETPYDSGLEIDHPEGGPTRPCPKWYTSLGSLRYPRQVRYTLMGDVTHNEMVARYREYSRSIGRLKTLETKAREVANVERLRGVTITAGMTLSHVQPDSYYYNAENPEANHRMKPFAETAKGLDRFAKVYPTDRVLFHLDGWVKRGYDNLHPDILPPCPEAGGWDGFKLVADTCQKHGWLFATHDNYIDFYQDAPTYSDELALQTGEDGFIPKKTWWNGGAQAFLCSKNAHGYVRRNYDEILARGVPLTATYIDVFAIMELYECYHPDHPMTREQDAEWRAKCFEYVRSRGIAVSSEEPVDWAVPFIEFCYWAPISHGGEKVSRGINGVSLPLFSQTYHDCMVVPWGTYTEGATTVQQQFLYAMAYGGVPLVNTPDREGDFPKGELERAKVLADLHLQTGFAAMERHDLLEPDGSRRLTTFAGGEEVEVDIPGLRYRVKGVDGLPEAWQAVE